MRGTVAVVLLVACWFNGWSQVEMRKYAIVVSKEDTIGYLKLTKTKHDDTLHYHYSNSVSFTFFKEFNISSELTTKFSNGIMQQSKANHYFNGNVYKNSSHHLRNGVYKVKNEKGKEYEVKEKIGFTAIQLFFHEPEGREKVYSETNCTYQPIKKLEEGQFQMIKSDGSLNRYYYKKGMLYKVYVENPLKDFHLLLVDAVFNRS